MDASDSQKRFWRLLSDYEELTRGETAAVQHRDYPSLEDAQTLKATILPVLQRTAASLGLDRTNCPALVVRLDAIAAAEAANLETLAVRRTAMQTRVGEMDTTRQRLRTLRNYHADPSPGYAAGSFAACG